MDSKPLLPKKKKNPGLGVNVISYLTTSTAHIDICFESGLKRMM